MLMSIGVVTDQREARFINKSTIVDDEPMGRKMGASAAKYGYENIV